jgi:hypothetical protein
VNTGLDDARRQVTWRRDRDETPSDLDDIPVNDVANVRDVPPGQCDRALIVQVDKESERLGLLLNHMESFAESELGDVCFAK